MNKGLKCETESQYLRNVKRVSVMVLTVNAKRIAAWRTFQKRVVNLRSEHAVARIFAVVCNLAVIVGKYNCSR